MSSLKIVKTLVAIEEEVRTAIEEGNVIELIGTKRKEWAEIFKHSNSADPEIRATFTSFPFILKVFRDWMNKTDDRIFLEKQRHALEKLKKKEQGSELTTYAREDVATSPAPAAPAPKPVNPTPMPASKEPTPPMKPPQQNAPKPKATSPVPTAGPYKEQKKVSRGRTVESENEDTTLPRQLQQTVSKPKRTSPAPAAGPSKAKKKMPQRQAVQSDSEGTTQKFGELDVSASEESAEHSSSPRHTATKKGKKSAQSTNREDESGTNPVKKVSEPGWKHRRPAEATGQYHAVSCGNCIRRSIRCEIEGGGGVCVACYKGKVKCDQIQRNESRATKKRRTSKTELTSDSEEEPKERNTRGRGAAKTRGRKRVVATAQAKVPKKRKQVPKKGKAPARRADTTSSEEDEEPTEDEEPQRKKTKPAPKKRRVSARRPRESTISEDEESSDDEDTRHKVSKRSYKARKASACSSTVPKGDEDRSSDEPLLEVTRHHPSRQAAPPSDVDAGAAASEQRPVNNNVARLEDRLKNIESLLNSIVSYADVKSTGTMDQLRQLEGKINWFTAAMEKLIGQYTPIAAEGARYLDQRVTVLESQVDYLIATVKKLACVVDAESDLPPLPTSDELQQQHQGHGNAQAATLPSSDTSALPQSLPEVASTSRETTPLPFNTSATAAVNSLTSPSPTCPSGVLPPAPVMPVLAANAGAAPTAPSPANAEISPRPAVHLVHATPESSQDTVVTHTTLVSARPTLAAAAPESAAHMKPPPPPLMTTRSRSRSRNRSPAPLPPNPARLELPHTSRSRSSSRSSSRSQSRNPSPATTDGSRHHRKRQGESAGDGSSKRQRKVT